MSVMSTIKNYRALSDAQKEFLKVKVLDGDRTPEEWLELLRGLAEFDAGADKARSRIKIMISVSVAILIGSFPFPPLFFVSVPMLVFFIVLLVWNSRMDMTNLRECVTPLLALLADDVKKGRTMHLRLDLRGPTWKEKLVAKNTPDRPGYRKVVETLYIDPWLEGDLTLADGARLRLSITDQIRERKQTKRSAGGKTKSKTKYKVKGLVDVRVKLPVARYRVAIQDRVTGGARPMAITTSSDDKWHSLSVRRVLERTELNQPTTLKPVIELLTRLYSGAERIEEEAPAHG